MKDEAVQCEKCERIDSPRRPVWAVGGFRFLCTLCLRKELSRKTPPKPKWKRRWKRVEHPLHYPKTRKGCNGKRKKRHIARWRRYVVGYELHCLRCNKMLEWSRSHKR